MHTHIQYKNKLVLYDGGLSYLPFLVWNKFLSICLRNSCIAPIRFIFFLSYKTGMRMVAFCDMMYLEYLFIANEYTLWGIIQISILQQKHDSNLMLEMNQKTKLWNLITKIALGFNGPVSFSKVQWWPILGNWCESWAF